MAIGYNQPGPAGASYGTSVAATMADMQPPRVNVPGPADDNPVQVLNPSELLNLGQKLSMLWMQYRSDRRILELRWLRNERQYLGIYDPEVDKELQANRSRAYPRITRVKCLSVLARLMSLMFPGDERNWEIKASPKPDMSLDEIKKAIQQAQQRDQELGTTPTMDQDYVINAVGELASKDATDLSTLIDDQLEELGGDQTSDYVGLNRSVIRSGIIYGLGVLKGPYAKPKKKIVWNVDPQTNQPRPSEKTVYMPVFRFVRVWDLYPDLSALTFEQMDGHFERYVMSRSQVLELADRPGFMKDQIMKYLETHAMGNYIPLEFEQELRVMGVRANVNEQKPESTKYEVIAWNGKTSGQLLRWGGVPVKDENLSKEMDAEIWMIESNVIAAMINPWVSVGIDVKTLHTFVFDEDDTSMVGFGLPNAIRDSQMAVSAATRMLMDNASVVCGPNLELNTDLLRMDQDLSSISAYKIWYRTGEGLDAQWPAVREIKVDSHLTELQAIVEMFLKFADMETFVGPSTGGDMEQMPSEPMRTAAGASMLRGDAALPFKDIVRSFDKTTQSVILSLVQFNKKFNDDETPDRDYNVIARGATSLMAKELRGMQIDQLSANMTPEEAIHVDMRKLITAKYKVRDLVDLLVSEAEADKRQAAKDQGEAAQAQQQKEMVEAQIREALANAFKNIAQGQKNAAGANADAINSALLILENGVMNAFGQGSSAGGAAGTAQGSLPPQGNGGNPNPGAPPPVSSPSDQGPPGLGGGPGGSGAPGGGQGLQPAA